MSDEEYEEEYENEYDAEEAETEDTDAVSETPKVEQMAEAKAAMLAAKKKAQDEADEKLREYEEQRVILREKEEEEIRQLKEKQELRRQEREKEEAEMEERRRAIEEERRAEEEARKARMDEEKRKKEEAKLKKQQMMQFMTAGGGPNYTIPQKKSAEDRASKFGNIVQAKAEMGLTKDQKEEQKAAFLAHIDKPEFSSMDVSELKQKLKEIHAYICKLEADRYDLENREHRQEYDLKELNERQRQISRNKAKAKGLDPEEAASSTHPPKVQVVSKYDRQIDRRNFAERRAIFDKPQAIPHFPNCPPPPSELTKGLAAYDEGAKEDEAEEEAAEEYEEEPAGEAEEPEEVEEVAEEEAEEEQEEDEEEEEE